MADRLRIVYAGTPEFAAEALAAIIASRHQVCAVYTQPDRPAGRGRKLSASPVKLLALEHGLPVYQPTTLKNADEQARLAELRPDVMVVAAYGLILPPAVLAIPRLGCLNIHASLLPRWRGAAPIQRAILEGDAETGITIMQMDAGLDTGDMLYKVGTPIEETDTAQTLHDRLAALGARAILETLDGVAQGALTGQTQDDAVATYAKKLDKAEADVDWTGSAERIARQVRAFNPWPVAQTRLGGDTLRIWQAHALSSAGPAARPGTVVRAGKEGIDVAAGEGVVRLTVVQMPGRKPMSAADFLNARNIDGAILGE